MSKKIDAIEVEYGIRVIGKVQVTVYRGTSWKEYLVTDERLVRLSNMFHWKLEEASPVSITLTANVENPKYKQLPEDTIGISVCGSLEHAEFLCEEWGLDVSEAPDLIGQYYPVDDLHSAELFTERRLVTVMSTVNGRLYATDVYTHPLEYHIGTMSFMATVVDGEALA